MDPVTQLQAAQASLLAKFADACANPRPSYSVDGVSWQFGDYLRQIADGLKAVNELLTYFDPVETRSSIL